MDVIVFGSLNMDLVAQVTRLPLPGETISGQSFATVPGGKGANQAVAAARQGASTVMVGRVGADGFGEVLRDHLQSEKIDVEAIALSDAPSGTALIAVAPANNQIIVVPGANGEVKDSDLERLTPYFAEAKVLLLQFEIPLPVVQKAAMLAHQAGLTVIVDPAPAQGPLTAEFCQHISILTPNQTEAATLTGQDVGDVEGAIAAAQILQRQGVEVVIIKLGALGCVCATEEGVFTVPAFSVQAVDTVAAGDAFNGGLAAALCRQSRESRGKQHPLKLAVRSASAVAALAVTQAGSQEAMPTKTDVETFLQKHHF